MSASYRDGHGTLFAMGMLIGQARADGVPAYLDQTGWHMAAEQVQHAVVQWQAGRETLLLRVHLDPDTVPAEARRLVWITPVPAAPTDVHVDILPGFPGPSSSASFSNPTLCLMIFCSVVMGGYPFWRNGAPAAVNAAARVTPFPVLGIRCQMKS